MMALNFRGVREDGSVMLTTTDGAPVSGRFMGQSSFATHALVKATSAIIVPPRTLIWLSSRRLAAASRPEPGR